VSIETLTDASASGSGCIIVADDGEGFALAPDGGAATERRRRAACATCEAAPPAAARALN
jgi:hypothetical protein